METSSHKRVYGRAELLALLGWDPKGLAEPYRLTEAGVTFEPDPQTWRTLTEEERGALAPPGWNRSDRPVLAFPFSSDELLHFVESSAQPALMRWRELEEKDAADAFASLASNRTARELAMLLFEAPLRMAWYDETLNADDWFNYQDVGPVQAALLFCMQKPTPNISEPLELAKCVTTEFTTPEDFERLHQLFECEAKSNPGQRTLRDWLRFALSIRPRGPRIHPWATWYAEVADQSSSAVPSGAASQNEAHSSADRGLLVKAAPAAEFIQPPTVMPQKPEVRHHLINKRTRERDLLSSLIEDAIRELDDDNSKHVYMKLKDWANESPPRRPLCGDPKRGLEWRDIRGDKHLLSEKNLRDRLRDRRKRISSYPNDEG